MAAGAYGYGLLQRDVPVDMDLDDGVGSPLRNDEAMTAAPEGSIRQARERESDLPE